MQVVSAQTCAMLLENSIVSVVLEEIYHTKELRLGKGGILGNREPYSVHYGDTVQ